MMRSAGCTINDMWDKDFDIHVCQPTCCLNKYRILFCYYVVVVVIMAVYGVMQIFSFKAVMTGWDAFKP